MLPKFFAAIKNKHFLSLAGNGIMSVVAMVTMAVLSRGLPISTVGTWVLFQASYILADTFRSGFLTVPFIKFYSGTARDRAEEVTGSAWFISIIITLALLAADGIAFMLLPYISDVSMVFFIKWGGITYLITLPAFIASCIQQGNQRFDRLLYIRIATQGTLLLMIIGLIIAGSLSLQTLLYALLASNILASGYTIMMGWTHFGTLGKRTKTAVKELYDFGRFSVTTTLSANFFRVSDVYIINFALGAAGPAAVAIYNLGQSLMQVVEIPLRSFVATGMPALSEAYNQGDKPEVVYTMKKYIGILTVTLIPVILTAVVFADFAIGLIGGGKYAGTEAANVFRLFMTFALLYPADRFFGVTLDAVNKPRVNLYKIFAMLIANVVTDIIGIYVFHSIYGVAFATIFPVMTGVAIGFITLNEYYPFTLGSIYKVGFKEARIYVQKALNR